jgi:hypothetical protein
VRPHFQVMPALDAATHSALTASIESAARTVRKLVAEGASALDVFSAVKVQSGLGFAADVWHVAFGGLPTPASKPGPRIYAIDGTETGLVKFGFSADPIGRLRELRTGSPARLALLAMAPGGMEAEARIHEHFADRRSHGEWFSVSRDEAIGAISRFGKAA